MKSEIIWGDVATWVTGIATIALFAVAFFQIHLERQARRKLEMETAVLKRRERAEQVSAWVAQESDSQVWIAVLNRSSQPIYQVIATLVTSQAINYREGMNSPLESRSLLSVAPPGQVYTSVPADYHGMNRRPGVEIAFSDGMGRNWVRIGNGELFEIQQSPAEHYKIDLPTYWRLPDTAIAQAKKRNWFNDIILSNSHLFKKNRD